MKLIKLVRHRNITIDNMSRIGKFIKSIFIFKKLFRGNFIIINKHTVCNLQSSKVFTIKATKGLYWKIYSFFVFSL